MVTICLSCIHCFSCFSQVSYWIRCLSKIVYLWGSSSWTMLNSVRQYIGNTNYLTLLNLCQIKCHLPCRIKCIVCHQVKQESLWIICLLSASFVILLFTQQTVQLVSIDVQTSHPGLFQVELKLFLAGGDSPVGNLECLSKEEICFSEFHNFLLVTTLPRCILFLYNPSVSLSFLIILINKLVKFSKAYACLKWKVTLPEMKGDFIFLWLVLIPVWWSCWIASKENIHYFSVFRKLRWFSPIFETSSYERWLSGFFFRRRKRALWKGFHEPT